jgi:3-hydroxyacyl-[acyl-carrier-protein] dehydratase
LPFPQFGPIIPTFPGVSGEARAEPHTRRAALMRFHLVDRILDVEPGKRLRAVKLLSLAEEYLADHFPTFPVMPGVLQLQGLVEAGAWLMRLTEDFARSVWVLREARGVKYGTFVSPGQRLDMTIELTKLDGTTAKLKGRGEVGGVQTVTAQLVLAGYNLRDRDPAWADRDDRLVRHLRARCQELRGPGVLPAADAT